MKIRPIKRRRWVSALLALVLVCAANGQAPAKEPTWDDVLAEALSGGYRIITTEELRDLYFKAPEALLLVDTRQEWEYGAGHIRGAVNFPMEPTWWARWQKADALERFLGADKHRLVVFY